MDEYRKKIDVIDSNMRDLFIQRMDLVKQVALYKKDNHLDIEDKSRQESMLEKIDIKDPLIKDLYVRFLTEIISVSKIYQEIILRGKE